MGVDYVDIFYSHRFDETTPLEETMGALDTAVRQGKALYVGISSYSGPRTRDAIAILRELGTPLLIHQPSYSMLNRWVEEDLLDVLGEEGVGCIAFSPLAQGMLTDKYLKGVPAGSRASQGKSLSPKLLSDQNLKHIRALNRMAKARGQSLAQMALAWILRDERVTSVLIGASSVQQLEDSLGSLDNLDFTPEELAKIDSARRRGRHQPVEGLQQPLTTDTTAPVCRVAGSRTGPAPHGSRHRAPRILLRWTEQDAMTGGPTIASRAASRWPLEPPASVESVGRGAGERGPRVDRLAEDGIGEVGGALGVAIGDGVRERSVREQVGAVGREHGVHRVGPGVDGALERVEREAEGEVVARLDDLAPERAVGVGVPVVAVVDAPGDDPGVRLRGAAARGEPGRLATDGAAHLEAVAHDRRVRLTRHVGEVREQVEPGGGPHVTHRRAPTGDDAHEACVLEPMQGLTHRVAVDTEREGELALGRHVVPGGEAAGEDGVAQLGEDFLGHRLSDGGPEPRVTHGG